jgi:hypothetical protein
MRTMFDDGHRHELLDRLRHIGPSRQPRWGRMTAGQVLPHLIDQMRITLGELPCKPIPGPLRYSPLREAALYWLPWPKGVIKGPPEAFITAPGNWTNELDTLQTLVDRFVGRGPGGSWPDHPRFGRMNGRDWGVFCHRHFDHHVAQFGG